MPPHANRKRSAARPAPSRESIPAAAPPAFRQQGDATEAALATMRDRVAQEVRIANESARRDMGADADGIVARASERALSVLRADDSAERQAQSTALDLLTDRLDDAVTGLETAKADRARTEGDVASLREALGALEARVRELASAAKPKTRKSAKAAKDKDAAIVVEADGNTTT